MVLYNNEKNDIFIRILFAGPAGGGKMENLSALEEFSVEEQDAPNRTLFSDGDELVFTEYKQSEETEIKGMGTGVYLYFPKNTPTDETLKSLIEEVDGVVFVLDAEGHKLTENKKEFNRFKNLMDQSGRDYDDLPVVLQFNSTSENSLSEEELDQVLNQDNLPFYLTDTSQGIRVEESLEGITGMIFKSLEERFEKDSDVDFKTFTDLEDILGKYDREKTEPEIRDEEVELEEELSLLDNMMTEKEPDTPAAEEESPNETHEEELFQLEDEAPGEIEEQNDELLDDINEGDLAEEMFDFKGDSSDVSTGEEHKRETTEEILEEEPAEEKPGEAPVEDIEIKIEGKPETISQKDAVKIPLEMNVGGEKITLEISISLSSD